MMDRHKYVHCKSCSKSMRSDNLKRHQLTHKDILSMSDVEMRQELRVRNETRLFREQQRQKVEEIAQQENIPLDICNQSPLLPVEKSSLEEELLKTNQEYIETIELGKRIAKIINKGVVREESLIKSYKEALDLYRKQKPRIDDMQTVQLHPWQAKLMEITAKPTDREVYWVCGYKGNEGKTWFQNYLETFYGFSRVSRLDLCNKTSNIHHALSKRPLQTTDIFLFNDTRAGGETGQNYVVLEHIKDGCALTSKYSSKLITFKTPNMIIVFSNNSPHTSYLSADRWRVYAIKEDGLRCINKGKNITLRRDEYTEYGNRSFDKHLTVEA